LLLVLAAALLPAFMVGARNYQVRQNEINAAVQRLALSARSFASALEAKVQGTTQLLFGLSRVHDLNAHNKVDCSAFLSEVLDKQPQYTGILTVDSDGSLFCDSLRSGRVLDLRDRSYFKRALLTTDSVVLEAVFGRLTQMAVLQIAYPVRNDFKVLEYILLASFHLGNFVNEHSANHRPGEEYLLVDATGTVMAWSESARRPDLLGTSIAGSDLFRFITKNAGDTGELPGLEGEILVWAVSESTLVQQAGLYVLVGRSKTELAALANQRLVEDLVTLAALTLVLLIGVWLVAEIGIRSQIGRIAAMATRLGAGNLTARISPPYPSGELGSLMSVLNNSAASMERDRINIENLNQKLSQSLAEAENQYTKTRKLEGELRQSQKMEALGQLTGGLAHDYNNLLTVILGNAELLMESLEDQPKLFPLAKATVNAADRSAVLTQRLLAFGRRQNLSPEPTDINQLLNGMLDLIRVTVGESIQIDLALCEAPWTVKVDRGQLETAILNLAVNARDAMGPAGILRIETAKASFDVDAVSISPELRVGNFMTLTLIDNGAGMSAATSARAFEPFFTTKDVGKGTGLGLSMVYGFVKQSGGHIGVYSEPGLGTSIKLYFPPVDQEAVRYTPSQEADNDLLGGTETILLVEDDPLVRVNTERQLASLGYVVVTAPDGKEALQQFEEGFRPDLLLTDVIMSGGMNGRELADRLRQSNGELRVLFMSGYPAGVLADSTGIIVEGTQFLGKPFRRGQLAKAVREALDLVAAN